MSETVKKPYSIGLDIGTNSVGWAVMYENFKIPSKKMKVLGNTDKTYIKKNFLGALLFDEGQTAADTRLKRTTKRRYIRRRNRLQYLQELFFEEMTKLDDSFFNRLEESFLVEDDKQESKYVIFGNQQQEKEYQKEFPTIYHLRKKLADSHEKSDLRLIYLALAHMIKFRGHFLLEGNIDATNNDVQKLFEEFVYQYDETCETDLMKQIGEVESLLTAKVSKTKKKSSVLDMFVNQKATLFSELLTLMVGNKADFKKYFNLEESAVLQISKDTYDADLENLLSKIGDDYTELFISVKKVYDAIVLSGILINSEKNTNAPLSASMIQRFDEHKEDLTKLKRFLREQLNDQLYNDFFKSDDPKNQGYAGYINGSASQEVFYNYTKKLLSQFDNAEYFIAKIEREDFLRKQRSFYNGAIPHQLHLQEMISILNNQENHYPFLKEIREKVTLLLTFRIPYYVGPLAQNEDRSRFAWLDRTNEAIRPWNFEKVVNLEKSAEVFIKRMTNNDLYLPEEKVLPKNSPLYQLFTVYNELTKVKFIADGFKKEQYFDHDQKREIVAQLFKEKRKVTTKDLIHFLENHYGFHAVRISGLTDTFNASLKTYHDFLKVIKDRAILDNPDYTDDIESIVETLTLFEDKDMIRKRLSQYDNVFEKQVLDNLSRRHYTGWGSLSRELINGIRDNQTQKTILEFLMDDDYNGNRNFMQLITDDRLSFKQYIEDAQVIKEDNHLEETVSKLTGSPAIKKGILQTIKVVEEIVSIMGHNPERIVVEMARENQTTKTGVRKSQNREKRLIQIIKELGSSILKEYPTTNEKLQNDRLYLYYLQNGKDMYTGDPLDIERLSFYDIDHIIPQSFIKDDSLDNKVLTSSSANRGKTDNVPSQDIVTKMRPFWNQLLNAGSISQRKYDNLTKSSRGGLTESDKANFIKRQLVETRQIIKNVAQILHTRYNKVEQAKQVKIVTLKSSLVSQFRKEFGLYKVREINPHHHAHDAYLNAVVAKLLLSKYPQLEPEFVYGKFLKYNSYQTREKATQKVLFYSNILKFLKDDEQIHINEDGEIVWHANTFMPIIKKMLSLPQVNIVKKKEIQTGQFSNATIKPKGDSDKLIPRKKGWEPKKYGGFDSPTIAYSILFVSENKKGKKVKNLIGITIMERREFEKDPGVFLTKKGYVGIEKNSLMTLPKYTLFEMENGRRRMLASYQELQKANDIVLTQEEVTLLYHANKVVKSLDETHEKYVLEHKEEFRVLFEKIIEFSEKYVQKNKVENDLRKLFGEKFYSVPISILCSSFVSLLSLIMRGASSTFIFFDTKISMDRLRYQSTTEVFEGFIIQQSITGLYETRIDLSKLGE